MATTWKQTCERLVYLHDRPLHTEDAKSFDDMFRVWDTRMKFHFFEQSGPFKKAGD